MEGIHNQVSLLQLLKILNKLNNHKIKIKFFKERVGDQKYFVNNINKVKKITGWKPQIGYLKGITLFNDWIKKFII